MDSNHQYTMDEGSDDGLDVSDDSDEPRSMQPLREQDRFLPIANVSKLMKKVVPDSGKIAKDARECVQECISEFISFITSEASDRCHNERRKTINGEDILFAMATLGFDNYVEPLKLYLQKYRETTKQEKHSLISDFIFTPSTSSASASSAAANNSTTISSAAVDQTQPKSTVTTSAAHSAGSGSASAGGTQVFYISEFDL